MSNLKIQKMKQSFYSIVLSVISTLIFSCTAEELPEAPDQGSVYAEESGTEDAENEDPPVDGG